MTQSTIPLAEIPQNWYMTWYMSTQAANKIIVTLKDNVTTYVDKKSRQSPTFGVLAEGFQQVGGTDLKIVVDIPKSTGIKTQSNITTVTHPETGDPIAVGYTISYEDATDMDFNDLCVSIMSWKTAG